MNGKERYKEAEKAIEEGRLEKARAIRDMILEGMSYSEMANELGGVRQSYAEYYKKYRKKI